MVGEVESALTALEARLADVSYANDIPGKKAVIASLKESDQECEKLLDSLHTLQQKSSDLPTTLISDVEQLIGRHSNLSAKLQVCLHPHHTREVGVFLSSPTQVLVTENQLKFSFNLKAGPH